MSEIEEVQEQMKADMEAMKEQMTSMMEAMMSMRKMMEVNMATIVVASTTTEVDLVHPSGLGYVRSGRQSIGKCGRPPFCASPEQAFLPTIYGLPPNYTPPNVAHAPDENVDNSAPILIESQ